MKRVFVPASERVQRRFNEMQARAKAQSFGSVSSLTPQALRKLPLAHREMESAMTELNACQGTFAMQDGEVGFTLVIKGAA